MYAIIDQKTREKLMTTLFVEEKEARSMMHTMNKYDQANNVVIFTMRGVVRACARCGDELEENNDLICGYHHFE